MKPEINSEAAETVQTGSDPAVAPSTSCSASSRGGRTVVSNKQKRGFADSLYHLLMTSPETGRRMGFYAVGNAPNGNLRIGMGTPDEKEFWILDITLTEASEFEVKAIKNLSPQNKNETPWEKTTLKILPQNACLSHGEGEKRS